MAIDPKLVSIKTAAQLPSGIPTATGEFLYFEDETLMKAEMSDLYDRLESAYLGIITPSSTIPATGSWYGTVLAAGTFNNVSPSITVDAADFDVENGIPNNEVRIIITEGVATKDVRRVKGDKGDPADPAKLPLYSDIKSADILAGTQFIYDSGVNVIFRTLDILEVGENPFDFINTKVEILDGLEYTESNFYEITDENNNVLFAIDNDGKTVIPEFSENTKNDIINFVGANIPSESFSEYSLDKFADINHVITYGQSLSVGQTETVLTTTNLFPNLINFDGVTRTSPYDKSLTGDTYPTNRRLAFVPITERVSDGSPATGTLRETPTSGTLESLAIEINKFTPVSFPTLPMKLLGSAPGWGATTIAQLSKGTSYYTQLIADVTAGKTLANAENKIYKVLAVTWTQGESDYVSSTTTSAYKSAMIQLRNDLNADIKAITGQSEDVAIVMYQTATSNGGGKTYPNIALAQYDLAINEDGFYMATAMYQMKYNDGFHIKSESSKLLGAYYGYVINKIISEGVDWKPLHPKSHTIQGDICKLKFEVPKAPLKFQAANTVTLANKGFAVIKGASDILTGVEIGADGTSVNLKCSEDPTGALIQYGINVTLTPGGTSNSKVNMGNLSDSQGDTQTFTIGGTALRMDNWSPIFEYQL